MPEASAKSQHAATGEAVTKTASEAQLEHAREVVDRCFRVCHDTGDDRRDTSGLRSLLATEMVVIWFNGQVTALKDRIRVMAAMGTEPPVEPARTCVCGHPRSAHWSALVIQPGTAPGGCFTCQPCRGFRA